MDSHSLIFTVFMIFAGAAIFSTLALYLRQSLLVAYMLFGILFGPWGLQVVSDVDLVSRVDDIGVVFLMFLLGLHLQPQNFVRMIGKTVWTALASSLVFFLVGFFVGYGYGFSFAENLILGCCMMFSSTIVSLKLLPTNSPKHQHAGEVMVGILLLQDLLAILALLIMGALGSDESTFKSIITIVLGLPALIGFVFLAERFVLKKIFAWFPEVREYTFLVAIAWCLGIAELAKWIGLSYEIGAFIAGLAIAASPIVFYISSQIQPIRDFFLVLFFFLIGASFNLRYFDVIVIPALTLTLIFVVLKPLVFKFLLRQAKEAPDTSWEIGVRLGQLSEFSLLVIFLANRSGLIGHAVVYLVQAVTMLMFIASSYLVVLKYPIEKAMNPVLIHDDSLER